MAGARARRTRKPTSISLDVQSGMRRSDRNSEDVSFNRAARAFYSYERRRTQRMTRKITRFTPMRYGRMKGTAGIRNTKTPCTRVAG